MRGNWGLQRTNRELAAGLQQSMRQRLRWSSRPEDHATLAVLHIKVGVRAVKCLSGLNSLQPFFCLQYCI